MKFRVGKKWKRRWLITAVILIPSLIYGLYPLTSEEFEITFDEEKIDFRKDFLADKITLPDSIQQPNIILILADDLGKTDISLYGSPFVNTQHIDAIAKNGVTFHEGYISSPICSPSRAGLMTGRYQQRFGYEHNVHERYANNRIEYFVYKNFIANTGDWRVSERGLGVPSSEDMLKQGLPPTEFIIPELLGKYGYKNAIIGKWHLGYNETAIPINRGFDYQYGFYEAFSLFAPVDDPNIVNHRHEYFANKHIWSKGRSGNCAIRRNHEVIEEDEYLTKKIADETCEWMRKYVEEGSPFFLYVPFSAPHTPFQAPKEYYDKYAHIQDENKRVYYAMIHSLDDAVGQITKQVDDLGINENTIIIFLSDNGGATYTGATTNAPLKGGKVTNFEGGLNIPFAMQWDSIIPAGTQFHHPASALDIFTTIMAAAHVELPNDRDFDGVDLLPFLTGEKKGQPHEVLCWRSAYHKAVRKGEWKMVKDDKAQRTVLYNLTTDKIEHLDVSYLYPQVVKDLENEYNKWEKDMMAPNWPNVMDYHIHDGEETFYFPL